MQVTSLSNSIYALEDDKHMENSNTEIIYRKGFGVYYYSLDLIFVLLFYIIF